MNHDKRMAENWFARKFREALLDQIIEDVDDQFPLLIEILESTLRIKSDILDIIEDSPEALDLYTYLYGFIDFHMQFDSAKLQQWSKEAKLFTEQNIEHSDFVQLFSSGVHFDIALRNAIGISDSTEQFRVFMLDKQREYLLRQRQLLELDEKALEDIAKNPSLRNDRKYSSDYRAALFDSIRNRRALIRKLTARTQDVADIIPQHFPPNFGRVLREMVDAAVEGALRSVANAARAGEYKIRSGQKKLDEIRQIKNDPSFRDRRGVIQFEVVNNQIAFAQQKSKRKDNKTQRQIIRAQLDKSLKKLADNAISNRVSNHDSILSGLLDEYSTLIHKKKDDTSHIIELWFIGSQIEERLKQNAARAPNEMLGEDIIHFLNAFLVAHNLYAQTFPAFERLVDDLERTSALARRVDHTTQNLPWRLLNTISDDRNLVEKNTAETIKRAASTFSVDAGPKTRGMFAAVFGILRGSLHRMGSYVLKKSIDLIIDPINNIAKDQIKAVLSGTGLDTKISEFFRKNASDLLRLSESLPVFFAWISRFLNFLGL